MHRSVHNDILNAWVPEIGFITIATLVCSLITLLGGLLGALDGEGTFVRRWSFAVYCAFPFFAMLALVDPFGALSSV
jgi:hypothetical protein